MWGRGGEWDHTCLQYERAMSLPIFLIILSSGENIALGQPATQANAPSESSSGEINMGDNWDLMLLAQALLLMVT